MKAATVRAAVRRAAPAAGAASSSAITAQPPADDACLRQHYPEDAAAGVRPRGDHALRLRLRARPAGQDPPPVHDQVLARRRAHHHARARGRPGRRAVQHAARVPATRCTSRASAWTSRARRWRTARRPGVHESQSRLWENIVGRSRGFWEHFYPQLQAAFPGQLGGVPLDTFYRAINKVERSLIRTDADEVTYNLHVMHALRPRAGPAGGQAGGAGPARSLARALQGGPRHRAARRPRRRAAGCALVRRHDRRRVPGLHARQHPERAVLRARRCRRIPDIPPRSRAASSARCTAGCSENDLPARRASSPPTSWCSASPAARSTSSRTSATCARSTASCTGYRRHKSREAMSNKRAISRRNFLHLAGTAAAGAAVAACAPPRPSRRAQGDALFVSPKGDDAWSGRLPAPNAGGTDGPFATLRRAKEAVHELKVSSRLPGPDDGISPRRPILPERAVEVRSRRFRAGDIRRLSRRDADHSTAAGASRPASSAAPSAWASPAMPWVAHLPDVAGGKWTFKQLFVNGQRRPRARLPKVGPEPERREFFQIDAAGFTPAWTCSAARIISQVGPTSSATGANLQDVEVVCCTIGSRSACRSLVRPGHAHRDVDAAQRVCAEGRLDSVTTSRTCSKRLSEPGEWYLDRARRQAVLPAPAGRDAGEYRSRRAAPRATADAGGRPGRRDGSSSSCASRAYFRARRLAAARSTGSTGRR